VSFAAITLCVASQRLFIVVVAAAAVYFVIESGNFCIHPHIVFDFMAIANESVELGK
jgi:hypothetical protein